MRENILELLRSGDEDFFNQGMELNESFESPIISRSDVVAELRNGIKYYTTYNWNVCKW